MSKLEPPDSHCLDAALGWLELGNPAEARLELDQVSPEHQLHPDVLEVRCDLHVNEQNWDAMLPVAHNIVKSAPERVSGWLNFALALRRVPEGGPEAAWHALLPASEKFPMEPTIPYNLACYASLMGNLSEARKWVERAMRVGGRERIRRMALEDNDLQPLWKEIRKL